MKIPENAFETYVAMGSGRSYQALADKLGVDKRSIVRQAAKEKWAERIGKVQAEARAATDRKLVSDLQAVRERQLAEARILEHRALEALKALPPEKSVKAAMMLQIAWKHELLLLGEPTDRQATTVEEVTKREIETLLQRDDEHDGWEEMEPGAEQGEGAPREREEFIPPPSARPTSAGPPPTTDGALHRGDRR